MFFLFIFSVCGVCGRETFADRHCSDRKTQIGGFDIILMNMAIMDVATLDPLADALLKLLNKDGV